MRVEMTSTTNETRDDLEATMQRLSLIVSLVGLGLMLAGFLDMLILGTSSSIPGVSVLPLPRFTHPSQVPTGLAAMSAGIVLLALLPSLRVLLAMWLYLRRHSLLNTLVALIVFVELLISMGTGG
jgi:uncharacterized membrane protein